MQRSLSPFLVFVAAFLASQAPAQDILFVTDSTNDRVVWCQDANSDGDLNDAGDITVFYDDVSGPFLLTNNVGICNGPGTSVLVSDTTEDIVLKLEDLNADGDALDPSEATIYFDGRTGGNPQGVLMTSANSLFYDASTGKLWIATQNTGTAGTLDEILVLRDLNSDGDANDLGEVSSFWTAPAGVTNSYAPQAIVVEPSGRIIYVDSGTATNKGAYELVDLNSNGNANDAGERIPFFVLPVMTTPNPVQQLFCLERDVQGWFYMADFQYDIVYRFKDVSSDGDAMDVGESTNYFVPTGTSTIWDLAATPCGTIYASDGLSPDRIYEFVDASGDGMIGAGESTEIYNESGGNPVAIGNGRGIAVRGAPCGTPFTPFCFGDGTGTACPCGNNGALGSGCANSAFAAGATLASSGTAGASAGTDTLVLTASDIPGPGLFFQGDGQMAGGAGIAFGDGLLCAGGTILRLGVVFPTGTQASYPGGLTPNPIHVGGATSAGDVRHYQCWYRDAAAFCTSATYNLTHAITLTWGP